MTYLFSKEYDWIPSKTSPVMMAEAISLLGTTEVIGEKDNPTILNWAKEIGVSNLGIEYAQCVG